MEDSVIQYTLMEKEYKEQMKKRKEMWKHLFDVHKKIRQNTLLYRLSDQGPRVYELFINLLTYIMCV